MCSDLKEKRLQLGGVALASGALVSTGWSTDLCGAALHVMRPDLLGLCNFKNVNWTGLNQPIAAALFKNTREPQQ